MCIGCAVQSFGLIFGLENLGLIYVRTYVCNFTTDGESRVWHYSRYGITHYPGRSIPSSWPSWKEGVVAVSLREDATGATFDVTTSKTWVQLPVMSVQVDQCNLHFSGVIIVYWSKMQLSSFICTWNSISEWYRIFSNFSAEQKTVKSQQLGIYGSQPEARRNLRKLRQLIRVRDGIQNGGILVSGWGNTWLEELGYKLFLLWWRRWKSQINNLFRGWFIRVDKLPTRSAVPRHFGWGWSDCWPSVGNLIVRKSGWLEHSWKTFLVVHIGDVEVDILLSKTKN